jgi:hypothetical protein
MARLMAFATMRCQRTVSRAQSWSKEVGQASEYKLHGISRRDSPMQTAEAYELKG